MNALSRYASKQVRTVIGLMSGTSADAIDAALVKLSGSGEEIEAALVDFQKFPYSEPVRSALPSLFSREAPLTEICGMNSLVGQAFGEAALALMQAGGLSPAEVDLIASHGQTVCHMPPRAGRDVGSTLQIGEPAVIAELTGVTVVADFRPRDMAAGGQGAPLTPYADYALFRHSEKTRAVQNIGGIANVTLLPAGGGIEDVVAFDTGPGNMIIDALVRAYTRGERSYDEGGALAARGRVDEGLLAWLMGHDFITRPPPKSTGREEFGPQFAAELLRRAEAENVRAEDVLTTATAFTAESIAAAYRDFLLPAHAIDEVILGGGGSYNLSLRQMLAARLPGVKLMLHEDFGINGDAKEALAFAILGNETMLGRPANLPGATGARRAVILGKIVLA